MPQDTRCLYPNHTEPIIKYFVTSLNNHKTQNRIRAGISFIDEASVERYKKQRFSFTNLGKITTVNKITKLGLTEMPRMALA